MMITSVLLFSFCDYAIVILRCEHDTEHDTRHDTEHNTQHEQKQCSKVPIETSFLAKNELSGFDSTSVDFG